MTETQTAKSAKDEEREREISAIILPEYELKVRQAQNAADEVGIALAQEAYQDAREETYKARQAKAKELAKEKEKDND